VVYPTKKSLKSDLWAHTPREYINILFFINLLSVEDIYWNQLGFPGGSVNKESACNSGDLGLIPESRGSPGEGNGYPFQYSCLKNPMDSEIGHEGMVYNKGSLSFFSGGSEELWNVFEGKPLHLEVGLREDVVF